MSHSEQKLSRNFVIKLTMVLFDIVDSKFNLILDISFHVHYRKISALITNITVIIHDNTFHSWEYSLVLVGVLFKFIKWKHKKFI